MIFNNLEIELIPAPIIYNLFPRLAGKFSQWKTHLERASRLHFNWIFVNPIQQPGFSGSMYSIKNYYQIDPRYLNGDKSGEDQLKMVIRQTHSLGLKIMIDLVINHTAIDSLLIREHPEWFKYDEKGKILNPRAMDGDRVVAVWGDLAEVDNESSSDRENLWQYWQNLLNYLLKLGFDGFRCDAAYQVPADLWSRLIDFAKGKNPELVFVAESLGCPFEDVIALGQTGFDFTFNSSKYWDFKESWAMEQYEENRGKAAPTISFAESHDTGRLAADLRKNWAAVKMRYLFSTLFSTGVMMPMGFEFGFQKPLHVVETTPNDWEKPSDDLRDFIGKANRIKQDYPVFASESKIIPVKVTNPDIFCYRKVSDDGKEQGIVIINTNLRKPKQVKLGKTNWLSRANGKLSDISPGGRDKIIPPDFSFQLQPGEVVVLWGENGN